MEESGSEKFVLKQKQSAIEMFLGSLNPTARTLSIYQDGHPMILEIAERTKNLLIKTLGQENTLVLDIKGKSVSVGELQLSDTKEINAFAAALHSLGIGQILFTNRISAEGMAAFLKLLVLKPDGKNSLNDIQKAVQQIRIDGLQMSFILSFVETGETEETGQKAGELSEDQILAFIRAETLPDFLLLLLRQNESLSGKEAETITTLLDSLLYREISAEEFQQAFPWAKYDPRIRERWNFFVPKIKWEPKLKKPAGPEAMSAFPYSQLHVRPEGSVPEGRNGAVPEGSSHNGKPNWDQKSLITHLSLFETAELETLKLRETTDRMKSVFYSMEEVRGVLEKPIHADASNAAMNAYVRLLQELGQYGEIRGFLQEFKRWIAPDAENPIKPSLAKLLEQIEKKVLCAAFAENFVGHLSTLSKESEELRELEIFLTSLSLDSVPLFLEELRKTSDQANRLKLCALLTAVCKKLGAKPFIAFLSDADWFVVRNVILILGNAGNPENAPAVVPLMKHAHQRVREEAIRSLGKLGGDSALDGLTSFIIKSDQKEEVGLAVTTLSLFNAAGVDSRLIQAYPQVKHDETRIGIATALGRIPTSPSEKFLVSLARRTWIEMLTGRNKSLRASAQESLEQLRKGKKS